MAGKIIGDERPQEEALQQMRERGGEWYAYQNHDMGHYDLGHLRFLQCGPERTLKTPPKRHPDTRDCIGWRYLLVGKVNLDTGEIEELAPEGWDKVTPGPEQGV